MPFVRFHRLLADVLSTARPGAPAAELDALLYRRGTPQVQELERAREQASAHVAAQPVSPDGAVRIPPAILEEWTAASPGAWAPRSLACFVHVVGTEGPVQLVLNGVAPGHSAIRSRVHRLLEIAKLPAGDNALEYETDALPAEIAGIFGTNVNLRSAAAAHEIDYPGAVTGRPAAYRISLCDLVVRHDREAGRLVLERAADGRRVRPLQTGMMAAPFLPRAARLLLQLFGDVPNAAVPTWAIFSSPPPSPPAEVVRQPRVAVGRVTVARATWYVAPVAIPGGARATPRRATCWPWPGGGPGTACPPAASHSRWIPAPGDRTCCGRPGWPSRPTSTWPIRRWSRCSTACSMTAGRAWPSRNCCPTSPWPRHRVASAATSPSTSSSSKRAVQPARIVRAGGSPRALPHRRHPRGGRGTEGEPVNGTRLPWRSIQVRYYDENKDGLILDALRPLLATLGDRVDQPYFIRNWRRGPHLRVNLRAAPGAWESDVRPAALETFGRYLIERPSTAVLDEAAVSHTQRLLAIRESEHGPLRPWYPDNTIQTEPYEDRRHVLGGQRLVDLLDTFHAESTVLAFGTLERIRRGDLSLFQVCLDLMIAFAHTSVPPISRGYMSFRSHADAFCSYCEDRDGVQDGFQAKYRQHAEQLRRLVRAQVTSVDDATVPAHVQEWLRLVEAQKAIADPLIAAKEIDLDAAEPEPEMRQLHTIDFHEILMATGRYKTEVLGSDWYLTHRLAINMLYAHLARLGLVHLQRYLFCHLIASAVEEEYGVSPLERARDWAHST